MKHKSIIFAFIFLAMAKGFSLDFDSDKLTFTSKVGDGEAEFSFRAINKSDVPEEITSIEGGCSCMSFDRTKLVVDPGKEMKVVGTFVFRTSSGKQRKLFVVHSRLVTADGNSPDVSHRFTLEGEIISPIGIGKSALIWLDQAALEDKAFSISLKEGFDVLSVRCAMINDPKDLYSLTAPVTDATDKGFGDYRVKLASTDLKTFSPSMRDYFSSINVTYKVKVGEEIKSRTERVDLLLAKDPKIKYDEPAK